MKKIIALLLLVIMFSACSYYIRPDWGQAEEITNICPKCGAVLEHYYKCDYCHKVIDKAEWRFRIIGFNPSIGLDNTSCNSFERHICYDCWKEKGLCPW